MKKELYFPGRVIDRANLSRWREDGSLTLGQRAHQEVERLVGAWQPLAPGRRAQKGIVRADGKGSAALGHGQAPARPVEA